MKRFTYKLSLIIVVALVFTTLLSGCKGEERGSTKPETVINNETEPTGGPAEESEVVGTEGVEDLAGTEDAEDEAGAT
ncbi:MAG TPA: hypothetical protein VJZ04_10120, partial [Lachnospiraceae bacterium]|nr:hypothetical protein [Lachnospiraceae bacterium]